MYSTLKIFGVCLLATLVSCGESTVKEEVAAYCDCIHGEEGYAEKDCMQMIEDMTIKYEYDPEALEIIEKELAKCNAK